LHRTDAVGILLSPLDLLRMAARRLPNASRSGGDDHQIRSPPKPARKLPEKNADNQVSAANRLHKLDLAGMIPEGQPPERQATGKKF